MKYIELTQSRNFEPDNGKPILINLEHVSTIRPAGSQTHIIFGTGNYVYAQESYEEVLKRIAEVNDKQFCLERRPAQPDCTKPFHKQRIISADAIYTGGGIWNYMGQIEDGRYFFATDEDFYDILWLDADPRKAGEDAYFPDWQEKHTTHESCDSLETEETLTWFRKLYKGFKTNDFIDKEHHISILDNYEYTLRMGGTL